MLLGSNTVGVIYHCRLPVIIIPEYVAIAPVKHLLYASDLKNITEEVNAFLPIARLLKATIKIIQYLHCNT